MRYNEVKGNFKAVRNNMLLVSNGDYFTASKESVDISDEAYDRLRKGESVIKFNVEVIDLNGTPTRNGVIYPINEMKQALKRERLVQMLNTGVFYGELEHPDNPEDLKRWTTVDRRNVHYKFTKFWFEGTKLMGEVQTVSGNGDLMVNFIKGGELPSFSIRVIGKPQEQGDGTVVLNEIHLIAVDWVTYPGNPTSYVLDSSNFKIVDNPLSDGFKYPLIKAAGEASNIAKEMGFNTDNGFVSLGNGLFMEYDRDAVASMESVRYRNNVRRNVLI